MSNIKFTIRNYSLNLEAESPYTAMSRWYAHHNSNRTLYCGIEGSIGFFIETIKKLYENDPLFDKWHEGQALGKFDTYPQLQNYCEDLLRWLFNRKEIEFFQIEGVYWSRKKLQYRSIDDE